MSAWHDGTGAIPGGVNKALTEVERSTLLADAYQMIAWARDAVALVKKLHLSNVALYNSFGAFRSNMLSLVAPDGGLDLYHGAEHEVPMEVPTHRTRFFDSAAALFSATG